MRMQKKFLVLLLIFLALIVFRERRVIAATLVNLTNQVTGILAHGHGGTDVSSPGAANNVLTSTGSAWTSSPPSGGGSGIPSTGTPNPKTRHWAYCVSSAQLSAGASLECIGDTFIPSNTGTPTTASPFCGGPCSPFPQTAPYAFSTFENSVTAGYVTGATWGTGQNLYVAMRDGSSSITVTNMRIRFGLGDWTNVAAVVTADTEPTQNMASFRFSKAVPDTNWICEAANGSAEATANSGVAVAADTAYVLEIQFNDSIPNIVYSINGTAVCTITTDLPSSSKALRVGAAMNGASTSGWGIFAVWHYAESNN
jgi:hypothetical protein